MIRLEETPQGVILSVRAQPGAKRSAITGVHDGALRVAVTAAPDKGKANEAIVGVLADAFQLAKSAVVLQSGSRLAAEAIFAARCEFGTSESTGC